MDLASNQRWCKRRHIVVGRICPRLYRRRSVIGTGTGTGTGTETAAVVVGLVQDGVTQDVAPVVKHLGEGEASPELRCVACYKAVA